jgi:hypothetical protein
MEENKRYSKISTFFQSTAVYYIILALILLLYDLNLPLNIVLYIAFIAILAINIKQDQFLYAFIPLVFFEAHVHSTLTVTPLMLSSLIKVYYIMFAIRVIIDLISKNKIKVNILSSIIAFVFIITAFSYAESINNGALYLLKTSAVVLYLVFFLKAKEDKDKALGEFLSMIAFSALIAGIYALTYNVYWDNRLCSTIPDPNYSSLIYSIGIFASFAATAFSKTIKIALTVILAIFLGLTMSITGFLITSVLLILYMLVNHGIKKVLMLILIVAVLLGSILFVPSEKGGSLYRLQTRINKFYVVDETDFTLQGHDDYTETQLYLNYITNNRYYLNQSYGQEFVKLPLSQQLFGGNNIMSGPKRDELEGKIGYVSHNSYLDMLFMIGLVPVIIILLLTVLKIILMIKDYLKRRSKQTMCMIFIKILVLGIGLTISIFPYRYFILFMLL